MHMAAIYHRTHLDRYLGNFDSSTCTSSFARPIPSATKAPRNADAPAICYSGKRRTQDYASLVPTQYYGTDRRLDTYFQPALGVFLGSFEPDLSAYIEFFFRQIHRPLEIGLAWLRDVGKLLAFKSIPRSSPMNASTHSCHISGMLRPTATHAAPQFLSIINVNLSLVRRC